MNRPKLINNQTPEGSENIANGSALPKVINNDIPEGLANIANGRDLISINEAGKATNTATQTIRKHLCIYGHFHGVFPIKIGGRQNLPVCRLAKLVRGETL